MKYTKEAISKKMEKDSKIRLIFKIIIYIIIIPIIIYNIYVILFWSINKTETPSFFGVKTYVIASRKYGANNKNRGCYNYKKM